MNKTIYALGFFDGVHVGHAALLDRCKTLAREENHRAGVVTFAAHPDTLVLGNTPPLINTPYDREKLLLERFSMEQVVTLPFDEQMHTMPWRDFLSMLIRDYAAAGFVCGEDFRFGYRGEGNADALEDFCRANGLVSAVVNDQMIDGIRVSSTYIRRQIETGDMETAVKFLGHPHILSGSVVHGHQLGRRLGIPTANLRLPEGLAEPKFGVRLPRRGGGQAVLRRDQHWRPTHGGGAQCHGGAVDSGLRRRPVRPGNHAGILPFSPPGAEISLSGRPESGNSPQRRGNESLLWGITPCFIRGNAV